MGTGRTRTARQIGFVLSFVLCVPAIGHVVAADLGIVDLRADETLSTPRYFPRGDGVESDIRVSPQSRTMRGCRPRRAEVPTNAPDDPSYVGSEYGLSKPSYYGFTPPRGVDDPYGRPVLAYCR